MKRRFNVFQVRNQVKKHFPDFYELNRGSGKATKTVLRELNQYIKKHTDTEIFTRVCVEVVSPNALVTRF